MATPAGTAAATGAPAVAAGAPVPAPSAEENAKKAAKKAAKIEKYRAQYNLPADMSGEDVVDHVNDCLTKKNRAKKDTTKKTPQQFPHGHKPPLLAALKEHCWRKSTFCQTEEDVKILAAKVCKKSGYAQWEPENPNCDANIKKYVDDNWQAFSALLNEHRNAVNGKIQKVAHRYLTENETEHLPPLDELKKIIVRDEELDRDLFAWWWEEVLPAVVGNSHHWDHKIYNYATISGHRATRDDGNAGKLNDGYVSPLLEAYAYFAFENNYTKWATTWKLKKVFPGKKHQPCTNFKKYRGTPDENYPFVMPSKDNKTIYIASDIEAKEGTKYPLRTLYSDPNAGQQTFGGFRKGAVDIAMGYYEECRDGRKSASGRKLEKEMYDILRTDKGITKNSYEEQMKKGKKQKIELLPEDTAKKPVRTCISEDDDSDEASEVEPEETEPHTTNAAEEAKTNE